jgi:hypothetical protein
MKDEAQTEKQRGIRHRCEYKNARNIENHRGYGEAITTCFEEANGEFWVRNDVEASRVNFCPYCGEKAPSQLQA